MKVQTVRGALEPMMLGPTMTHEHFFWDQTCWWPGKPQAPALQEIVYQKVSVETRGQIFYHAHLNLDNIKQDDISLAIEEARHLKKAGGATVVDVTSIGIGRNPLGLVAIAEATGLNIVMGSGYYIAMSHPDKLKCLEKEEIAALIVQEFVEGVEGVGIKPGVIGEIGISNLENTEEIKFLQAAAIAQRIIGAPLYIHPPIFRTDGHAILDIIEREGADLSKIVLCHCDPTLAKPDYHDTLAKRGVFIEYDQFGLEILALEGVFLPRDIDRIGAVREQIQRGNLNNILLSQDVCFKICLVKFGGWGYAHILRDIKPLMNAAGITSNELSAMLIENPRRLLAF